jgi:hypothetical protein
MAPYAIGRPQARHRGATGRGAGWRLAAVTTATRITGKVTSIAGIAVGDLVSATITGTAGKLTADTIQDPASLP